MAKQSIACNYGMNFKIDGYKIVLPLTPLNTNNMSVMSEGVQNPCDRCGSAVYPAEKMDVGRRLSYHQKCFRCKTCGLRLSLKTFYRKSDDDRDIFCILHVPKAPNGNYGIDAMGISSPLRAPKRDAYNNEVRSSPAVGWQYTPTKLDLVNSQPAATRTPLKCLKSFVKSGILKAQLELEESQRHEEDDLYRELNETRIEELNNFQKTFSGSDIKQHVSKVSSASVTNISKRVSKVSSTSVTNIGQQTPAEEDSRDDVSSYEDKRMDLLERLEMDETTKVAKMIEKHSREMLDLIAQTEHSLDSTVPDASIMPDVQPPQYNKYDIYFSETLFRDIDNLAEEIAQTEQTTFTELVYELTKDCESELEKARALFRWITCKDLNAIDFEENTDPNTPLGLLRGIKSRKESYHHLFKRLCSYVGLHCEVIRGFSKGVGYKPGQQLHRKFKNSWTAVNLDGHWRFVNCQWGARHTKSLAFRDYDAQLCYKQDEFYFMTDPEEHIYQHFPNDPKWQLLVQPYSKEEFIRLPLVKSPFFNNRFQFASKQASVLYTGNGTASVKIRLPVYKNLCGRLRSIDGTIRDKDLEGLVVIDIDNYIATVTASPPAPGRYTLDVHVQDAAYPESMEVACKFLVRCSSAKEGLKYYPDAPYFGPTPMFTEMGLSVDDSNSGAIVVSDGNDVKIRFQTFKGLKLRETLSFYRPKKRQLVELERCTLPVEKRHDGVTYIIRCPTVGRYVFSLFAAPDTDESELDFTVTPGELRCVYRALVECRSTFGDHRSFPNVSQKWWADAKLISPLCGELDVGTHVEYKLELTSAVDVCVVTNNSWSHLELVDGLWTGMRYSGVQSAKVRLYAKFEETGTYKPIIEYVLDKATAF